MNFFVFAAIGLVILFILDFLSEAFKNILPRDDDAAVIRRIKEMREKGEKNR